jgi:hypothetical protein
VVDIAEYGDPGPIWFAYLPGAEALKLMYSEPQARGHFYPRPEPLWEEREGRKVRVYGEMRRGIWWEKAHERVSPILFTSVRHDYCRIIAIRAAQQ